MKKLLSLVALVTLLAGLSTAEGAAPVEGSWGMRQQQNGFTFDMTFTISATSITLTNVCSFQGKQATARVTAPAQFDATTLTVLGSASDQQSNDGVNCDVSVRPDRMNYVVNGNFLTLTHDGQSDQFTLTRK